MVAFTAWAAYAAIVLSVIGMMLVIAGALFAGLFLPGIVVLVAGMVVFAIAGVLRLFAGSSLNRSRV